MTGTIAPAAAADILMKLYRAFLDGDCSLAEINPLVVTKSGDLIALDCKMNIDDSPNTPNEYGVSSIPTLILFKDGEAVQRVVGAKPKSAMQSMLDAAKG